MASTSPDTVRARLKANLSRRERLQRRLDQAMEELAELVLTGREAKLTVTEMASLANRERQTIYKDLLRAETNRNGGPRD